MAPCQTTVHGGVARVCVPVADSCHFTMVVVCVVAVGMLYRWGGGIIPEIGG
jgi:hypothetical protein